MSNNKHEKIELLKKELELYKHFTDGRVRFHEVDSFGVVHNVQYFYWLESARTYYLESLGMEFNPETYNTEFPVMVVHAEMDYFNAARFNDDYRVYTRIPHIGDSSFRFENIITGKGGNILVKASAILVHLDPSSKTPTAFPEKLRDVITGYEDLS